MSDSSVLLERVGRVALVTLNRPEKLNAMSAAMRERLREIWTEVRADDGIRVAVLRGQGPPFSTDVDLSEGGTQQESESGATAAAQARGVVRTRQAVVDGILSLGFMAWDLPKPVIAQIHGYCLGKANVLASLMDMRIVAKDT